MANDVILMSITIVITKETNIGVVLASSLAEHSLSIRYTVQHETMC